jgi:putative endonuclease
MKQPCVYILASERNGTLYVGVTSDLTRRLWEHKTDVVAGFTRLYRVHSLVHAEFHGTMIEAITREKQIKKKEASLEARADRTGESGVARSGARPVSRPGFPLSRE